MLIFEEQLCISNRDFHILFWPGSNFAVQKNLTCRSCSPPPHPQVRGTTHVWATATTHSSSPPASPTPRTTADNNPASSAFPVRKFRPLPEASAARLQYLFHCQLRHQRLHLLLSEKEMFRCSPEWGLPEHHLAEISQTFLDRRKIRCPAWRTNQQQAWSALCHRPSISQSPIWTCRSTSQSPSWTCRVSACLPSRHHLRLLHHHLQHPQQRQQRRLHQRRRRHSSACPPGLFTRVSGPATTGSRPTVASSTRAKKWRQVYRKSSKDFLFLL